MNLKIREIQSAVKAVNALSNGKVRNNKVFYWITVAQRKLWPHLEPYEKTRNKMLMERGKRNEVTKTFEFPDAKDQIAFENELETLLDSLETVEINTIKLSLLLSDESLELTPLLVTQLGPLVELDESELKDAPAEH